MTPFRRHRIVDAAETVARIVTPRMLAAVAAVTSAALRRRDRPARVVVATATAAAATEALKPRFHRRRPAWFDRDRRDSFPSGHSAASTAYLLSIALVVPRRYRPLALAVAAVGIVAVDVARVLGHDHWISDVIAGDAVGGLSVLGADALVPR